MIPFEAMPEDNAKLASIAIAFPRLEPDTASSCPIPMDDVLEYLRVESPDGDAVQVKQLRFLRTAQVAEQRYWIWAFQEADGTDCYVTVSVSPGGESCVGYDANHYGLSPDQFLLGDYHEVF